MFTKRFCVTGMAAGLLLGLATPAHASAITFDSVITKAADATYTPGGTFVDTYEVPPQGACPPACVGIPPASAFTTQGFTFGGFTMPVTTFRTSPELNIMLDPSQCFTQVGANCASDGSRYLIGGDILSMFFGVPGSSTNFSFFGFDATGMFGPAGCPRCDPSGTILGAEFVRVVGVRNGAPGNGVVADETFALTSGFQSLSLTDPDWSDISKVVIRPVDATGATAARILALDNLQVSSVPEPASLVLLGTGLAALVARRRLRDRR